MKLKEIKEYICSVDVLNESEQISFIMTNISSYVVGCIPDARNPGNWKQYILTKVNSIDEAEAWYRKHF